MKGLVDFFSTLLHTWDKIYGKARNGLEKIHQTLLLSSYQLGSRKIGSPGYGAYRQQQVEKAIAQGLFSSHKLPENFGKGLDERVVEYPWVFSRLPPGKGRLLDAGSTLNFDSLLRKPVLQNKQVFISTLAPESHNYWWRGVSYTFEDLRAASFRDGYFDWIVCLSTLEHVGMDTSAYTKENAPEATGDAMTFLKELHRMLKPGGTLFLSFPFGKKANKGWMQVFDLAAVEKMVETFRPQMASQSFYRQYPKGWKACTPQQAEDAQYFEKSTDSLTAAEAIACLELVK